MDIVVKYKNKNTCKPRIPNTLPAIKLEELEEKNQHNSYCDSWGCDRPVVTNMVFYPHYIFMPKCWREEDNKLVINNSCFESIYCKFCMEHKYTNFTPFCFENAQIMGVSSAESNVTMCIKNAQRCNKNEICYYSYYKKNKSRIWGKWTADCGSVKKIMCDFCNQLSQKLQIKECHFNTYCDINGKRNDHTFCILACNKCANKHPKHVYRQITSREEYYNYINNFEKTIKDFIPMKNS
jgi:hypothetical protein